MIFAARTIAYNCILSSMRGNKERAAREINATVLAQEVQGTYWTVHLSQTTTVNGQVTKQMYSIEVSAA